MLCHTLATVDGPCRIFFQVYSLRQRFEEKFPYFWRYPNFLRHIVEYTLVHAVKTQLDLFSRFDTYTHPFNGPLSGTTRVSRYQNGKPMWILLKQETVSGSGISWAICKSAPLSRQITTPAPHHSVFTGRMPFLPPNQQRQSSEGNKHWRQRFDTILAYNQSLV